MPGGAKLARPLPTRAESSAITCSYQLEGKPIGGPVAPLGNFVLVKVEDADAQTIGGIVIPDKSQETKTRGEIVGAGPGRVHPETGVLMPMAVKAGERVVYGEYDGSKLDYCGCDHMLIRDDDILLAYEGEKMTLDSVHVVHDRLLVQLEKAVDEMASGIILAPGASEQVKSNVGKIVKVGDGKLTSSGSLVPLTVAVGDTVKFRDYGGSEVMIEGRDYMVVKAADCLCKWIE